MTKKLDKIKSYINKYDLTNYGKEQLLKRISYYKEEVIMPVAKKFEDVIYPKLNLIYVYDDVKYHLKIFNKIKLKKGKLKIEIYELDGHYLHGGDNDVYDENDILHYNFLKAVLTYLKERNRGGINMD